MPVTWLCHNVDALLHCLFYRLTFLTPTHTLFSSVRVPTSGSVLLYYTLNAQLFLQPLPIPHSEQMFSPVARFSHTGHNSWTCTESNSCRRGSTQSLYWLIPRFQCGCVQYVWIKAEDIIYFSILSVHLPRLNSDFWLHSKYTRILAEKGIIGFGGDTPPHLQFAPVIRVFSDYANNAKWLQCKLWGSLSGAGYWWLSLLGCDAV
jgi:hypothetical protein